jgi:energy-coupling factor transporter ATP-binding protein EcfA2
MLIHSIKLANILSFGPSSEVIRLRPLNIIIGPNGSGKSNLLEAIDLLRNAPEQITRPVREGGGDTHTLRTACRRGFSEFLEKTGLKGYMPRIVACGSRNNAYGDSCTAIKNNESAMLLVDSESPVAKDYREKDPSKWDPRRHLTVRQGDGWTKRTTLP